MIYLGFSGLTCCVIRNFIAHKRPNYNLTESKTNRIELNFQNKTKKNVHSRDAMFFLYDLRKTKLCKYQVMSSYKLSIDTFFFLFLFRSFIKLLKHIYIMNTGPIRCLVIYFKMELRSWLYFCNSENFGSIVLCCFVLENDKYICAIC